MRDVTASAVTVVSCANPPTTAPSGAPQEGCNRLPRLNLSPRHLHARHNDVQHRLTRGIATPFPARSGPLRSRSLSRRRLPVRVIDHGVHGHSTSLLLAAERAISAHVACQSQLGIFAIHSSDAVRRCAASARRCARVSALYRRPCLNLPLRSPAGAPDPLAPPCSRQRFLPSLGTSQQLPP
jgi:hypothetical protein